MTFNGAFRERLKNSWVEMRENLTRSILQSLGVILGVASVLGGFSISDSMRRRSMELYVKMGGLDKLNVRQSAVVKEGAPTALQMANLGLRSADAEDGEDLDTSAVHGISLRKDARARVRSPYADQEREIRGIGGDFLALEGFEIEQGRNFTAHDIESAAPVAILGTEAVSVFFPNGDALGRTIRIGDTPVTVVGLLEERVFRYRKSNRNMFRRRNRIIAIPTTLVTRRFEGDQYQRVDRVTFRLPNLDAMATFSKGLTAVLKANHRQQEDFRLDDVGARVRKEQSQGDVYDIIFMLSAIWLSDACSAFLQAPIAATSASATVSTIASGRSPFSFVATICVVITRNPPPKMYGALNEPSAVMNVNMAAPMSDGRKSGTITRRKVARRLAPSAWAASSIETSSLASPARVKR